MFELTKALDPGSPLRYARDDVVEDMALCRRSHENGNLGALIYLTSYFAGSTLPSVALADISTLYTSARVSASLHPG